MTLISNIAEIIERNPRAKIAVFVRHGEKSTEGFSLISDLGMKHIQKLAENLKKFPVPIKIYSSPILRCVQAAEIINDIVNLKNKDLIVTNKLGEPGMQIRNNDIYQDLYKVCRCREIFGAWKQGNHFDALYKPSELKNIALNFISSTCTESGITLYVSQSGTVAGVGYSLGLCDYDTVNNEWIDFCDGFVLEVE